MTRAPPSGLSPVSVTFVGTGDAFNSGGRRSSSYLITAGDTRLVVDCGPTTPHALHQLGADPGRINARLGHLGERGTYGVLDGAGPARRNFRAGVSRLQMNVRPATMSLARVTCPVTY